MLNCIRNGFVFWYLCRPELSIRPWDKLEKDLQHSNEMIKWTEREPYAYWKGNAVLGEARRDLMKCNVSGKQDWNARIYGLVSVNSVHFISTC